MEAGEPTTPGEEDRVGLLFSLDIHVRALDGRVVTCCMDSNVFQVLGDLQLPECSGSVEWTVLSGVRDNFRKFDYSQYPVCLSSIGSIGIRA